MNASKIERHHYLLETLKRHKKITVSVEAGFLQVAPETIRKDLAELESKCLLTRVHGGAIRYIHQRAEPEYVRKYNMEKEAKKKIAKEAAKRIQSGTTVAIDVGTTTVHIADAIRHLQNVTVVTNSLPAAERLNRAIEEGRMTGKVIMLGGVTNPSQSSVSGALTLQWLDQMNIDLAIISCGGIVNGGVYDYDLDESFVSSKMLEKSKVSILVADETKIAKKSFHTICQLDQVHEVISNDWCPPAWSKWVKCWTNVEGE